jgi:TPR repeat protein
MLMTSQNFGYGNRGKALWAILLIVFIGAVAPSKTFAVQSEEQFAKRDLSFLGVGFALYTSAEEKALGYSPKAAVVSAVYPETPAAEISLHIGDVIQEINGSPIQNRAAAEASLLSLPIGSRVSLTINRQGNLIRKETNLISMPENILVLPFRDATQGNAQSQYVIGLHYLRGSWIDRDSSKAHYWLRRAAEGGVGLAYGALAEIYEVGDGVPMDKSKARLLREMVALEGAAEWQVLASQMMLNGVGGPVDIAKGMKFLEMAAEQGHAEACFKLGENYFANVVVSRNDRKSLQYYLRAAELGHKRAAAVVGNMYAQGLGTPKDYASALTWLTIAAHAGIDRAQHDLGAIYSHGQGGIPQDWGKAALWLGAAAEQGFVPSMSRLGYLYRYANPPDLNKAVNWLSRAVEGGDLEACNDLGLMYWNGEGVSKDGYKAFSLMKKAADGGLPIAKYHVGIMYAEGTGVAANQLEAVKWLKEWFHLLTPHNRARAAYILAVIYDGTIANGNVAANPDLAFDYYRQAAQGGHLDAQRVYGQRLRNRQQYQLAAKWLHEAATRGDRSAQNDLGTLYYYGQGVVKSREEAIAWWLKAYRQGSTTARDSLRKIGVDAK